MDTLAKASVIDSSEDIAVIECCLILLKWAKRLRKALRIEGQLHYTGDARWEICEPEKLWKALWDSLGKNRAREIGAALKAEDAYAKVSWLKKNLTPAELGLLASYLRCEWEASKPDKSHSEKQAVLRDGSSL